MSLLGLFALSACLSKPERPDGPGFPGDEDGGGGTSFDSGYQRDSGYLLRRQVAVGDLDGDGQDDAVVWGNAGESVEQQGQRPIIRVYFGGPGGLVAQPDIDMRFDQERPWYEVLDVAIEPSGGLAFLTAEDLAERDSAPPRIRRVRSGVIEVSGQYIGSPVFRSQHDMEVNGYVDAPAPAFIVVRDNAYNGEARLVFGFEGWEGIWLPTVGTEEQLIQPYEGFLMWEEEAPRDIQEAFTDSNADGGEDMLIVTRTHAGRTAGDASAGQAIFQADMNGDCSRVVRADAEYGTLQAFATCEGSPELTLISSLNESSPPTLFRFDVGGSGSPTDLEFKDMGGDLLTQDLMVLSDGELRVYGDLAIGPPVFSDWEANRSIDGDYDLIVAGHFHGPGVHQIYLFSTRQADLEPVCYEVDGVQNVISCP